MSHAHLWCLHLQTFFNYVHKGTLQLHTILTFFSGSCDVSKESRPLRVLLELQCHWCNGGGLLSLFRGAKDFQRARLDGLRLGDCRGRVRGRKPLCRFAICLASRLKENLKCSTCLFKNRPNFRGVVLVWSQSILTKVCRASVGTMTTHYGTQNNIYCPSRMLVKLLRFVLVPLCFSFPEVSIFIEQSYFNRETKLS